MTARARFAGHRRWPAAALAALVELALAALVVFGLAAPARLREGVGAALATFDVAPPPPPPPPREHHATAAAAAAPARKTTPVVAPPVKIALAPSVPAAPHSGAAVVDGTGTGAGGVGLGTGSGIAGNGDGDGGSDAEWTGGRITDRDYPAAARDAREQGVTRTRIAVSANGRATGCTIRHSSGSRLLDETTCRLVLQRFRFRAARDEAGRAVDDFVDYDHEWIVGGYAGD